MSEKEKKIPKRRFKEFQNAGEWEQRKVGELTNVTSAARVHKEEWASSGIPFFRSSDVVSAYKGIKNKKAFISYELFEQLSRVSGKLGKDDILVTGGGSIGIPYIVPDNAPLYSKDADLIWIKSSKKFNSQYLYTFFMTSCFRNYIRSISHIGTIAHYTIEQVKDTPIYIPSSAEQEKVGVFFKQLDNIITLHQCKLDKMKALKKAYLTDMFPSEGESKPKLRFAGFTDEWEQCELEDVYKKIRNAFVGTATPYYVEEGHFYLESNNVKNGQINRNSEIFINDEFYERQKDNWLHTNDLVMVQSGHVGHAAVIPENLNNTAAHALIIIANPREKINPYFVNYQFQTKKAKHDIDNITIGNTIKHILSSEMKKFEIYVCEYKEQKKIGELFKQLDNLITLHQRKLEKLQNIKKAYLNEMFI